MEKGEERRGRGVFFRRTQTPPPRWDVVVRERDEGEAGFVVSWCMAFGHDHAVLCAFSGFGI